MNDFHSKMQYICDFSVRCASTKPKTTEYIRQWKRDENRKLKREIGFQSKSGTNINDSCAIEIEGRRN